MIKALQIKNKKLHPFLALHYKVRIFGALFVAFLLFYNLQNNPYINIFRPILIIYGLIWPHATYFCLKLVEKPFKIAYGIIYFESFFLGFMLSFINFTPWPTIAIILALAVTLLSTGGFKKLIYGSMFIISGILLSHFIHPPAIKLASQTVSSIISIIFIFLYTLMISSLMLSFSTKYYEKKNSLKDANDEIHKQNRQFIEDLALARKVQMSIIPRKIPEKKNFQCAAIYDPMKAIGGDFYDFLTFKEQHLFGVFISDVSGHGVPAALITSMIKTLLDTSGPRKLDPADLLNYLNDQTLTITSDNFFTAFYCIIDTKKYTMTYARAGHNYPYLIRGDSVKKLESNGTFLGILPEVQHERKTLKLKKGDTLFFYTDGLTEVINHNDEEYGDQRLIQNLKQKNDRSIAEFIRYIYDAAEDFNCEEEFKDDVCIIGIDIV